MCSSATHGELSSTQKPIEELLPPLTSSNEVDLQLYAIIAVIVKDFVYAWYTKITPDHVFVDEVVQIIAHCTRALEQRLRRVDLAEMVLDEIPALVDAHVQASRIALSVSETSPFDVRARHLYHSLNPHPAMNPAPDADVEATTRQVENEVTYRQLLIQGTLAVLLPTEDLENVCLRTLVADVIADLIIGQGVGGKACQPWFIFDMVSKIVGTTKARIEPKATGEEVEVDTKSRLEKFGLLSSKDQTSRSDLSAAHQSRVSTLFWRILQYCYLSYLFLRFVIVGMSQARSAGPRSTSMAPTKSNPSSPVHSTGAARLAPSSWSGDLLRPRRPVLKYRLFSTIARLLDLSSRMPWLLGSLSWIQYTLVSGAGRVGDTEGIFDRFLLQTIQTRLLPPTLLAPLLHQARITLFPNNSLGPPAPPPPSFEEQLLIRRRCAEDIISLIPDVIAHRFFSTASSQFLASEDEDPREDAITQVEEILNLFGDEYMNKHLVCKIVELIIVRLVPELGNEIPSDILKERVGNQD